jgi:hypothetical protein
MTTTTALKTIQEIRNKQSKLIRLGVELENLMNSEKADNAWLTLDFNANNRALSEEERAEFELLKAGTFINYEDIKRHGL